MIPLLDANEMRSIEDEAIQKWGMASLVLQEHAALGALNVLTENCPYSPIHVLAGPGNNGGDALALARLARLRGLNVDVWPLCDPGQWKGDAAHQARLWEGLGGAYRIEDFCSALSSLRGVLVDGLFGLGTRLPLHGKTLSWIESINQQEKHSGETSIFAAYKNYFQGKGDRLDALGGNRQINNAPMRVLALDLPTGLDPSSAEIRGPVLRADMTACFGHLKRCHGMNPAKALCGQMTLVAIPLQSKPLSRVALIEAPKPPLRHWNTHKRDFGHVGIRAGCPGMSGAAVLAAMGALRMGAGLVTLMVDGTLRAEIAAQVPEAMVQEWTGKVPDGIDVLLVGPGGVNDIPEWTGPLVLDASALLANEGKRWMERRDTVITPHTGEFSRLFAIPSTRDQDERIARVGEVATGPGILVLKGAQTLVAGGGVATIHVNPTGHPGLSTGGTGDFLAGMVAAGVAGYLKQARPHQAGPQTTGQGGSLREAVEAAVWLHGASADRLGEGPLLVRELINSLSGLLREWHGR